MKKTFSLLLVLTLAVLAVPAWAAKAETPKVRVYAVDTTSGTDWLLMNADERADFLAKCMKFLEAKGIPLRRNSAYYGSQMNVWVDQPGAHKALIINLLTTIVYKDDPRTHVLIDKMRNKAKGKTAPAQTAYQPKRQVI